VVALLDLLLPPACAGCGRVGALLCRECRATLTGPSDPGGRFLAPDAGVVIGDALQLAVAAFAYEGPTRRALAALKYTGASRLAPILAQCASPTLAHLMTISGPASLVPVPLHPERQRARGYNQAALLARCLGKYCNAPIADALARVRPTTKQHRLNRVARLRNLRDAFTVVVRPPRVAILVDDIITTSATVEACASVLRAAGCESVYGFALAREV
jgi:ComF family protein